MGVSLFPAEQKEYFDLLYHWKKAGGPTRSLALLSGDMHFAMKSVVRKYVRLRAPPPPSFCSKACTNPVLSVPFQSSTGLLEC
jgi:hypothetical protein